MSDERFKDFDAYWAEQGREPLRVKVFGEEHELPSELPATLSLRLVRMQMEVAAGARKNTDEVDVSEVEAIAEELFTKPVLEKWFAKGMGIDQLTNVLEWALSQYGASGDEAEGEPEAPEGTSTASSNGGRSSKRTSGGSTRSTSRAKAGS